MPSGSVATRLAAILLLFSLLSAGCLRAPPNTEVRSDGTLHAEATVGGCPVGICIDTHATNHGGDAWGIADDCPVVFLVQDGREWPVPDAPLCAAPSSAHVWPAGATLRRSVQVSMYTDDHPDARAGFALVVIRWTLSDPATEQTYTVAFDNTGLELLPR